MYFTEIMADFERKKEKGWQSKGKEKRLCYEGNSKEPDPENMKGFTRKERETLDENQTIRKKNIANEGKWLPPCQSHYRKLVCYWLFIQRESDSRWILFLA